MLAMMLALLALSSRPPSRVLLEYNTFFYKKNKFIATAVYRGILKEAVQLYFLG